jgi:histidyl-tRNA synthetase
VARDLRSAGLSVELGLDGKLKRALELANKLGARFAVIAGSAEMAAGKYVLKNMATSAQETIGREELAERMK